MAQNERAMGGTAAPAGLADEGRLEAALERIARASAERARPAAATPAVSSSGVAAIAGRLDTLITELRDVLAQQPE